MNQLDEFLKKYNQLLDEMYDKENKCVALRTVLLMLFILLIILGIKKIIFQSVFIIGLIVLLGLFLGICIYHSQIKKQYTKYLYIIEVIHRYKKRMNNTWNSFEDCGDDFKNDDVLQDLDIVGVHSLFQYLNIAVTDNGRNKLFKSLSNPDFDRELLLKKQEAVKELTEKLSFCIEFQQLLEKMNKNVNRQLDMIDMKKYSMIVFFIDCFLSVVSILLAILSLIQILPYQLFMMNAIIKFSFSLIVHFIYNEQLETIKVSTSGFINVYQIFCFVEKQQFQSELLRDIQSKIIRGNKVIERIKKINSLDTIRYNFLSYVLVNCLFPLNTYLLYMFYCLSQYSLDDLYVSISSFEEMEVLMSLSVLGVCQKNICMPTLCDDIKLNVKDIRHPLLNNCIENSFECKNNIIIITGSNMSGKTSFMRTIAVNLVLMYAGGYVNASSFEAPYLKIMTSMRVKDDIEKGISTFYGELLRMKEMIDYGNTSLPLVCFVDEIFKGTNYNDRMIGAKSVIERLSLDNVILFITTHDFELCDIDNKKIVNYYFEEYYKNQLIYFDYKIKSGKCKTTNAKYLMKQLNII